jgi:hypothetical protein
VEVIGVGVIWLVCFVKFKLVIIQSGIDKSNYLYYSVV